jgi:hypothetical protein
VLTIAIHTTAVVLMAFGLDKRVSVRAETHQPDRLRAIPKMIGHIGAVALTLAALHGVESVLWASAYWGLGALDSLSDASVYALATMTTFEIPGLTFAAPIPDAERPRSDERRAAVRHQHGIPFRCPTGPLAVALSPTRTMMQRATASSSLRRVR